MTSSIKTDAMGSYVEAAVPAGRPGTGNWVLTLGERFNGTDVCGYRVGQFSVCNYVLNGNAGQCCTQGDLPVAVLTKPMVKYG